MQADLYSGHHAEICGIYAAGIRAVAAAAVKHIARIIRRIGIRRTEPPPAAIGPFVHIGTRGTTVIRHDPLSCSVAVQAKGLACGLGTGEQKYLVTGILAGIGIAIVPGAFRTVVRIGGEDDALLLPIKGRLREGMVQPLSDLAFGIVVAPSVMEAAVGKDAVAQKQHRQP